MFIASTSNGLPQAAKSESTSCSADSRRGDWLANSEACTAGPAAGTADRW